MVKTQVDALAKADWIIETTITSGSLFSDTTDYVIMFEDIKTLKSAWAPRKIYTGTAILEPCHAELRDGVVRVGTFDAYSKRYRVFGTKPGGTHDMRVFYIEPVSAKFAAAPSALVASPATPTPKMHRSNASNLQAHGWHLARSTDGKFSIHTPTVFYDATVERLGTVVNMIRSVDNNGIYFAAVREPASASGPMSRSFDNDMAKKDAKITVFKGVRASVLRVVQDSNVMDGLHFKTATGTYMLMVVAPKEKEHETKALKDRFFNSFSFD